MQLHELVRELPVRRLPPENPEVTGISHDSRRVGGGDLFVAIVGERFDGRAFSTQAVERGAVAVLGPGAPPPALEAPWVEVADPRPLLGPMAARLYGQPDEGLLMIGVTGTNGKSTVTVVLERLLAASGRPTGALGTLGYHLAGQVFDPRPSAAARHMTTPEASDFFHTLAEMRQGGAEAVVMEVSSHALALGRVAGARFDVAVLTNVSRDHLDFHRDLEDYFETKCRLFDQLKAGGRAVVHVGDDFGRRLAARLPAALTFGAAERARPRADVSVISEDLGLDGIQARIATPRGEIEISSALLGRFNLDNLVTVVAVAEAVEIDHAVTAETIAKIGPLPGRLQPVDAGQSFPALVDFAHTPAALEALLTSFREIADRKIALVFGCGGDRDPGKRTEMGEIAGRLAELPVLTSDNPRSEEPLAIIAAVEKGLMASGNDAYHKVPDRGEAIRRAVAMAAVAPNEWAVLVAGKGHEEIQVVDDHILPFSDRDEIAAAVDELVEPEARHG
ncbi:MAG: UDP-N-acetylmuramoyl-L-alanyl-D-glutamate--2,6-diaminopimelate ligase [Thermoanaerobaculia bacterium]